MKKRSEVENEIELKKSQILKLYDDIRDLERESWILSDDKQWYTEETQTVIKRVNRKKVTEERQIGVIHWNEDFKDEDSKAVVTIERQKIVKINGEWVN